MKDLFNEIPVVETSRCILRPLTPDDANDLYEVHGDKDVTKYQDWDGPESRERLAEIIGLWNGPAWEAKQHVRWGIVLKETGTVVGSIYLFNIGWDDPTKVKADIGYELAKSCWNKGLASEVVRALTYLLLDTTDLNRLQALVMLGNNASMRVLEKVGFVREGILREFVYFPMKALHVDMACYSLIERDVADRSQ